MHFIVAVLHRIFDWPHIQAEIEVDAETAERACAIAALLPDTIPTGAEHVSDDPMPADSSERGSGDAVRTAVGE